MHKETAVQSELVLPKEKIMIYKETSKLYAYCISGSLESLEIIFKILKSKYDDKPTR